MKNLATSAEWDVLEAFGATAHKDYLDYVSWYVDVYIPQIAIEILEERVRELEETT